MKNYFSKGIIILFILMFLNVSNSFAASDPMVMLESLANEMISTLKTNKASLKNNPELVYSYANRIVVPHADLAEMARRVLPPQTWNNATSSQRSQFQKEFTNILIRTYATALADYKDQAIQFYPVRGGYTGKSTVKVDSRIVRSDGPSIPVSYRLVLRGSEWKLYDMSVEGVSLLESFRSQFADRLSQGDIDGLIKSLSSHNTRGR